MARLVRERVDALPAVYRDAVVLGSAGALIVAGKAQDLKEGAAQAAAAIDSGAARKILDQVVRITNEEAAS